VGDLAHAEFITILQYVASLNGCVVHHIHRFFPSSKLCSQCGHLYQELSLSERNWVCLSCNTQHDRDANAARQGCQRSSQYSQGRGIFPWVRRPKTFEEKGSCRLTPESHEL
jgi:hypothetical protein